MLPDVDGQYQVVGQRGTSRLQGMRHVGTNQRIVGNAIVRLELLVVVPLVMR